MLTPELSVDLRDASGEGIHFDESAIAKDGTTFESQIKHARKYVPRLMQQTSPNERAQCA